MRPVLRAGLAAAALLASTATPASAQGAVVVNCRVTYRLGAYTNGAGTCQVTGEVNGTLYVLASSSMAFSVLPGTLPRCLDDRAMGSMSGALSISYNWSRVGEAGVFSTSGDVNGTAVATFSEASNTEDSNITCGMVTTQSVTMVLAGT